MVDKMERNGLVIIFTDSPTKDPSLMEELLRKQVDMNLSVITVLFPKYRGQCHDESWKFYQKLGPVFELEDKRNQVRSLLRNSLKILFDANCDDNRWTPGWCVDAEKKDQNTGLVSKAGRTQEECLESCKTQPGVTGCEFSPATKSCKAHTKDVSGGSGADAEFCYVFPPAACPATWSRVGSSCFKLFGPPKTWEAAERHCNGEGGHLAAIHNSEENELVASLGEDGMKVVHYPPHRGIKSWVWIGGNDRNAEHNWVWTDKSRMASTGWSPGNPNNGGGKQDCAVINYSGTGRWDDQNCDSRRKFVCKKAKS